MNTETISNIAGVVLELTACVKFFWNKGDSKYRAYRQLWFKSHDLFDEKSLDL